LEYLSVSTQMAPITSSPHATQPRIEVLRSSKNQHSLPVSAWSWLDRRTAQCRSRQRLSTELNRSRSRWLRLDTGQDLTGAVLQCVIKWHTLTPDHFATQSRHHTPKLIFHII